MYFKTLSISRYLQSVSFKATRLELKYYIILWPHDSDLGTIYTVLFYKLRISLTSFKFSGCCLFFVFCFFFCFFFFHTSRTCWKYQSKEVLRSQKWKDIQYNGQKKMAINSSQNITQNTELEWQTVHDPPVEPVVFLSNDMNIIWYDVKSINTNMNFLQNISMFNWNDSRHYNT